MAVERRRVVYRGRVQGVGFRYMTQRLARGVPVSGFVRNLDDGGVELVAQGESADVVGFLDAIRREFGDKIRDACEESLPADDGPGFQGFSIRR